MAKNGRFLEKPMDPLVKLIETARNNNHSKKERHQAFGQLMNQFYDAAYGWAFARLGEQMLAQDAVQEGFVVAYQNLHTLQEPKAFPGWFRQIIFSQCSRLTRNKQLPTHSIETSAHLQSFDTTPEGRVEDDEIKENVLKAIHALPEHERIVTKMFYLNGYSQKEIARLLQIPLTTVKKRLQYARRDLKGMLATMVDSLYPAPQPQPIPIPIPVRRDPYPPLPRAYDEY